MASISPSLLRQMDACWRAANYLSVGQIYLYDNPLLKKLLRVENVKLRGRHARLRNHQARHIAHKRVVPKRAARAASLQGVAD